MLRPPTADALQTFEVAVALGFLATVTVFARFVARRRTKTKFLADDYITLVAWVFMMGLIVNAGILVFNAGLGHHELFLTPDEDNLFGKAQFTIGLIYLFTMALAKVSILLLYRRLFTPFLQISTMVIGLIICAWCISGVLVTSFQCDPIAAVWDFDLDATCIDPVAFSLAIALTGGLTDLIVLVLPLQVVWRLHLPIRQKLVLSVIFSLGGFVCIASVIRIVSLNELDNDDLSYTLPATATWSLVEANLALTCANLPLLRPLLPGKERFVRIRNFLKTNFGSVFSRSSHDRSTNSGQSDTLYSSPRAQELKPLASAGSRMSGGRFDSQPDLGPNYLSPIVQEGYLSAATDDLERGIVIDLLEDEQ
ncbi:hypothetical protein MMC30_007313, partial [Trapelia coarctata]|nr:hypothetical protein [Trapelia coarctata]